MVVQVQVRELRVARLQIEHDVALRLGRAAADLGDLVFEAVRQIDARPVSAPVTGFLIGSPWLSTTPLNAISSLAGLDVHLEFDRREDRVVDFLDVEK